MFDYQVGGNAVKIDASEGMADIPMNRSLFVQKLTADDPVRPEAVYDLKTVDEVFEHFKPAVDVEFETQDGSAKEEKISFNSVADFKSSNMVQQSAFLQGLNSEKEEYAKIMKQLKTNKLVKSVTENPELKEAFVAALQNLIQELDGNK
jgi:predicted component of type VI protein secretion system